MSTPLLQVEQLTVQFETDDGLLTAVDEVGFEIAAGEHVGLVGESGCGKSVTALSLLQLVPRPPARFASGRIRFDGRDLLTLPPEELHAVRGAAISMIFQDPMNALSPLMTIGEQLEEALLLHERLPRAAAREQAIDWLRKVGLPDPVERMRAFPHQLSGGMRQRVMIAMALMLHPRLVVADEPTTALDVTIQAQIFALLRQLQARDTALLLITHDLGVVAEMCERVLVMYAGRIVEMADRAALFEHPGHPYTAALLRSMPARHTGGPRLLTIPGQVPSPLHYPGGCRFRDRCPCAFDRCARECPPLYPLESGGCAACFRADPAARQGGAL